MKAITRNVFILGLVSLLNDLSSEMAFVVLPFFLTDVLKAPAVTLGLIEGIAASAASILKFFSGWFSDRIGRRKFLVVTGYGLSAVTKPFFGLAGHWGTVLAARLGDRVGKGLRDAPRDAILAEAAGREFRGRVFGFHRAMDTTGAIFGPLAALLLLPLFGYRQLFYFAFIPTALAVLLLVFFLKIREKRQAPDFAPPVFSWRLTGFPSALKRFFVVGFIFSVANFSYAFLLLRAESMGLAVTNVMAAYIFFNVVYTLASYPFGRISDRIGRKGTILLGYGLFTLFAAGLTRSVPALGVPAFFLLYGLVLAITESVPRAFVADLAPEQLKATALGAYNAATGIAALPASVIAGLLWDRVGPGAPFVFGAILGAVAFVLLWMFVTQPQREAALNVQS